MFATPAFAQAAGAAGAGSAFASFVPLVLIFAIMYFLLIRPQQKKMKELKAMVEALRRGDQVVTAGQNRLSNGQPATVDNSVNPAADATGAAVGATE